jgi:hypothetical protein
MLRLELIFLHSTNGGGCFRWRDEDSTYLPSAGPATLRSGSGRRHSIAGRAGRRIRATRSSSGKKKQTSGRPKGPARLTGVDGSLGYGAVCQPIRATPWVCRALALIIVRQ